MRKIIYILMVSSILGLLSQGVMGQHFDPILYPETYKMPNPDAIDFFWNLHVESENYHNITGEGEGSWESYTEMGSYGISTGRPLIRSTAIRVLAYLQAYRVDPRAIYLTRAQQGLTYLLNHQDTDGSFPWEYNQPYNYYLRALDTGLAGRALVEGYRRFGNSDYLTAAEQAANWHLAYPQYIGNQSNVNYYGLAAWNLASVYEEDGNTNYLEEAVVLCDSIMMWQDYTHGTDSVDGTWYHCPMYGYYDKKMVYHCMTLRGLLETYHVVKGNPAYSTFRTNVENSIVRAINYMIGQQRPDKLLDWALNYNWSWVAGLVELAVAHEYLPYGTELNPLIYAMSPAIIAYGSYQGTSGLNPETRHADIVTFGQYLHRFITSGETYPGEVWSGTINISGDVTVPVGLTLTIEPGTTVIFAANQDDQNGGNGLSKCELIIQGKLQADGVTFTSSGSNPGDWYGIVFDHAESSSYIRNSTIEEAIFGVYCDNTNPNLHGNTIQYNSSQGIHCDQSSPSIYQNTIQHNGIGIFCKLNSHPYINDNYIINNNSYGIYCLQTCNPYIRHNEISSNNSGGVVCLSESSPQLVGKSGSEPYGANKIIANVGNGVWALSSSNPNLGVSPPGFSTAGYNDIYDNTAKQVYNSTSNTIIARVNWWGTEEPGSELFYGSVDYTYPLTSPSPYAGPTWGGLAKASPPIAGSQLTEPEEYLQKAQLLEGEEKYEDAIMAYRYVVNQYGETEYGSFALARLLACRVKQGDITVEKNYLGSVFQKYSLSDVGALALLWQPLVEARLGNGQLAVALCNNLMSTYAGSDLARDAWFEMGILQLYELNDSEAAKQTFAEFTQAYPKDPLVEHITIILDNYRPPKPQLPKPKAPEIADNLIPVEYVLSQNYPNPFNPETEIRFQLPEATHVSLKIYNMLGQKVRTLVDMEHQAGYHTLCWDGKDDHGRDLASGVYIYRIEAGLFVANKKMLFIR